jgi:predicted amidophosphoribosyltransferase
MIRVCCPQCRLRFSPAATAYINACPDCGQPLKSVSGPQEIIGFRLIELDAVPEAVAQAVSLPVPDPNNRRL